MDLAVSLPSLLKKPVEIYDTYRNLLFFILLFSFLLLLRKLFLLLLEIRLLPEGQQYRLTIFKAFVFYEFDSLEFETNILIELFT